jgi:hypothetical protein
MTIIPSLFRSFVLLATVGLFTSTLAFAPAAAASAEPDVHLTALLELVQDVGTQVNAGDDPIGGYPSYRLDDELGSAFIEYGRHDVDVAGVSPDAANESWKQDSGHWFRCTDNLTDLTRIYYPWELVDGEMSQAPCNERTRAFAATVGHETPLTKCSSYARQCSWVVTAADLNNPVVDAYMLYNDTQLFIHQTRMAYDTDLIFYAPPQASTPPQGCRNEDLDPVIEQAWYTNNPDAVSFPVTHRFTATSSTELLPDCHEFFDYFTRVAPTGPTTGYTWVPGLVPGVGGTPGLVTWEAVLRPTDSDGDNALDYWELFFMGTDPLVADTDGDGDDDAGEAFVRGTNPRHPAKTVAEVEAAIAALPLTLVPPAELAALVGGAVESAHNLLVLAFALAPQSDMVLYAGGLDALGDSRLLLDALATSTDTGLPGGCHLLEGAWTCPGGVLVRQPTSSLDVSETVLEFAWAAGIVQDVETGEVAASWGERTQASLAAQNKTSLFTQPCRIFDMGIGTCVVEVIDTGSATTTVIPLYNLSRMACADSTTDTCVAVGGVEIVVTGISDDLVLVACADLGLGCDGYTLVDPTVTDVSSVVSVSVSCSILLDVGPDITDAIDPVNLCDPAASLTITHIDVSCTIILNLGLSTDAVSTCEAVTTTPATTTPATPTAPVTPTDNGGGFPTLLVALVGLLGLLLFAAWKRSQSPTSTSDPQGV